MIRSKANIRKLPGWEFQKAISAIPTDHDIILRMVAENGDVDLKWLQYTYIYTEDEDKGVFIDALRRGLEHIKNDDMDALYEMGVD